MLSSRPYSFIVAVLMVLIVCSVTTRSKPLGFSEHWKIMLIQDGRAVQKGIRRKYHWNTVVVAWHNAAGLASFQPLNNKLCCCWGFILVTLRIERISCVRGNL